MAGHAQAAADMALGMVKAVEALREELQIDLSVRIGLNTGPVVAGVIGKRKFSYDLWGDAMNTASRMESHGRANAIQVTHSTREALGSDYLFEERGEIEIRGKGTMRTWWLIGKVERRGQEAGEGA